MTTLIRRNAIAGPTQNDAISGVAIREDATTPGRVWRGRGVTTTALSTGGVTVVGTEIAADMLPGLVYEIEAHGTLKNGGVTGHSGWLEVQSSGDNGVTWAPMAASDDAQFLELTEVPRFVYELIRPGTAVNRLRLVGYGGSSAVLLYGVGTMLRVTEHGTEP